MAETLPDGWESRLVAVAGYDNVFALDVYDLALVKLMGGRPRIWTSCGRCCVWALCNRSGCNSITASVRWTSAMP